MKLQFLCGLKLTPQGLGTVIASNGFGELLDLYLVNKCRVLTPDEAQIVLSSLPNPEAFLPSDMWLVKYECFRSLADNYDIPIKEFQSNIVTSAGVGGRVVDLSFGTIYDCPLGHQYFLDFYADRNLDEKEKYRLLASHMFRHLIWIGERQIQKTIGLVVEYHGIFNGEKINYDMIRDIIFNKLKWPVIDVGLNYYEKRGYLVGLSINALARL